MKIYKFFIICLVSQSFAYSNPYNFNFPAGYGYNNEILFRGNPRENLKLEADRIIFPGTKWCGAGNVADNIDDLGSEWETDVCCRTHDFCPDFMEGHEIKNDLINPDFHSRFNCECDYEFFKCLKLADTDTSRNVGLIYFTLLGTQCYKKDYPIIGCKKHGYFPKYKCLQYEQDSTQEPIYQWFDLPNFD